MRITLRGDYHMDDRNCIQTFRVVLKRKQVKVLKFCAHLDLYYNMLKFFFVEIFVVIQKI